MNTELLLNYLQIFGWTVFGLFFFILIIIAIYGFYIIIFIRKTMVIILEDIRKILGLFESETLSISQLVKNKIESINIEKALFGSTVIGGIISGLKVIFNSKSNKNKKK